MHLGENAFVKCITQSVSSGARCNFLEVHMGHGGFDVVHDELEGVCRVNNQGDFLVGELGLGHILATLVLVHGDRRLFDDANAVTESRDFPCVVRVGDCFSNGGLTEEVKNLLAVNGRQEERVGLTRDRVCKVRIGISSRFKVLVSLVISHELLLLKRQKVV